MAWQVLDENFLETRDQAMEASREPGTMLSELKSSYFDFELCLMLSILVRIHIYVWQDRDIESLTNNSLP